MPCCINELDMIGRPKLYIVSCYSVWLLTNEAIVRSHAFVINSISQLLAIIYSSVSNVVFSSEPTACPVVCTYSTIGPSPSLYEELDSVSEHMIKVALSLTSCPRIASTVELVLMAIFNLLLFIVKGGLAALVLETVNIHNVWSKILEQHAW